MPRKRAAAADAADDVKDAADSAPPSKKAATRKTKKYETAADTDNDDLAPSSEAQFAKTVNFTVPVDEHCQLPQVKVYIDGGSGIIYDCSLNQTNAGKNANKFYRIQLLEELDHGEFLTWTRWGRVGEVGQSALLGSGTLEDAMSQFQKKFKDKTGLKWEDRLSPPKPKKYTLVEISHEADPDVEADEDLKVNKKVEEEPQGRERSPPKCTLSPPVKSAMELIFNAEYLATTMADLNYDANKLPLGKLSRTTITRGYEALKTLSEIIDDPTQVDDGETFQSATERLSNAYFSVIPHAFGRNRPPVINEVSLLRREIELLDSLTDMKIAASIEVGKKQDVNSVHILDSKFNALNISMDPVESESKEFTSISTYLNDSRGSTHGHSYDIVDIFRIEREGEAERFEAFSKTLKSKSNRRLLYHGSRSTLFGSILSQGLRIAPPEAPVNGYMFGKGIYLADASSKSANYCHAYSSGGHALLMLLEAELGSPTYDLTDASYTAGEDALSKGCVATFGQGLTGPKKWKDAGAIHPSLKGVKYPDTSTMGPTNVPHAYLQYNEYIAYSVSQVRIRYLLRVKMDQEW